MTDLDDDDNDYRASQRRRHDVPAPLRIRRRLLLIAESPLHRWHEDVVDIARMVTSHDDDNNGPSVRETFVRLVCQLVQEQPLKTPFVASVLLAVNALKKPEIVLETLRAVASAAAHDIAQGRWRAVKLSLRFLACLQPCLEGDGVFPLLDTLFDRAVDLQTASSEDVIGTELVKIILLTIPYVMAAVDTSVPDDAIDKWRQRAADLMEKTDVIASEPHALQGLMDPCHHGLKGSGAGDEDAEDGDEGPVPAESLISLLQKQLQNEAASGWPLTCLPRIAKRPLEAIAKQCKQGGDRDRDRDPDGDRDGDEPQPDQEPQGPQPLTKLALPAIAVPKTVIAGPQPLFPEVYFSVYGAWVNEDATTAPSSAAAAAFLPHSVPPLTNVASSLVRDALVDTVNGLHFNRNVTARFLIDIDCYFADETFVKRATPFDRLRDVEPGRSTWKPEDVAVDTVFAQLFQLPQPEHKLVYYHAVLAEACKIAPAAIAPSLGRAIRFLYRNSPRMDLELVSRFVDWFAHHLSNFGFTWKWAEWADDVQLPDLHPHKAFILAAIDKEIRLSFAQRIKNTLPDPYKALIRPEMELDGPTFKYSAAAAAAAAASGGEEVPFAAEGRELAALLKRKAPDEELQTVIERIHSQALDDGGLDPLVTSTDVFMTAVLWVGSKSLSHVLAAIERTKDRLLDAGAASDAARVQILEAVVAFWGAHPGVAVAIAEKLLNYAILTPAVIVRWALSTDSLRSTSDTPPLAVGYVAELVFNTVNKVTHRVHQLVATSQAAAAAVPAATKALDAAREHQRNPPPPPPPAAVAKSSMPGGADDLDVAMEEDGGAAAASALAEAVAAAAADASAAVEAAEAALAQATADAETARVAEAEETSAMRELFAQLGEALQPWLSGTAGGAAQDKDLVRAWATRWQRVVQRQAAVEEGFLRGEAAKAKDASE